MKNKKKHTLDSLPHFEAHVGSSTFLNHIENRYLMVDKTLFVKHFLKCPGFANLITRPRRWGKTFNFSILQAFFALPTTAKGTLDARELEKRRAIFGKYQLGQQEPIFCQEHLGQYPTVLLSFKDVTASNAQAFEVQIQRVLGRLFLEHHYLLQSSKVLKDPKDRSFFEDIQRKQVPLMLLEDSLEWLIALLYEHFGKKCILLIDEYDTPLNASFAKKIASFSKDDSEADSLMHQIVNFFLNFLGPALKGSESKVQKIAITGILRLAKSNLFSGVNNLKEFSIFTQTTDPFVTDFGFTESEIQTLLQQSPVASQKSLQEAQAWYNGYEFQGHCLYNPWSISNWVAEDGPPQPYWIQTSRNDLLKALLKQGIDQGLFETLFQGEWVSVEMKPLVTFEDFESETHRAPLQWTLLAATGYVTLRRRKEPSIFEVKLPNHEVKEALLELLNQLLVSEYHWVPASQRDWGKALLEGKVQTFCAGLRHAVSELASYHHTQKGTTDLSETFYHGLVMGMVVMLKEEFVIESEVEAGEGRLDLLLLGKPNTPAAHRAYLLEFKVSPTLEELPKKVREALTQIRERDYPRRLRQRPEYTEAMEIGLAFCGKSVDFAFRKFGETDEEEIRALAGEYYDPDREKLVQKIYQGITQATLEKDPEKGAFLFDLLKKIQQLA